MTAAASRLHNCLSSLDKTFIHCIAGPDLIEAVLSICKCLKVNLHSQSGLIHQRECGYQIYFASFQYTDQLL